MTVIFSGLLRIGFDDYRDYMNLARVGHQIQNKLPVDAAIRLDDAGSTKNVVMFTVRMPNDSVAGWLFALRMVDGVMLSVNAIQRPWIPESAPEYPEAIKDFEAMVFLTGYMISLVNGAGEAHTWRQRWMPTGKNPQAGPEVKPRLVELDAQPLQATSQEDPDDTGFQIAQMARNKPRMTYKNLAKHFSVSLSTVKRALNKHGVKKRGMTQT